ncbi:MAG: hypothetical protein JSU04_20500 [Bdellovibrionales bacterium]|nr:hypothetical protein [Bdellovibrionales bacterium]
MSETQGVEIPKTMLILKSNVSSLAVVETFLRNRGWRLYSTANLKEALVQIVSNKPSYILISVDHPNKKVRALPKLLAQAFPVACIAFAENQNSTSFKMLNEAATEYRVYPPVTGPAIERCVNKYLKDQQTRATVQNANDKFQGQKDADGNDMISIKGGGNGNIEIKGGGEMGGDAGKLFAQLLGEEGSITTTATSNKVDNNNIVATAIDDDDVRPTESNFIPTMNSGNKNQENSLPPYLQGKGENSGGMQNGQNGFGQTYVQKGSSGPGGTYVPPAGGQGGFGNVQNPNGFGSNYINPQDGGNGQPRYPGQPGADGENGWSGGAPGAEGTGDNSSGKDSDGIPKEGLGSREYRRRQAASNWAPMQDDRAHVERIREKRARSDANQTLIARGTQKSLEESVMVRDGVVKEKAQDNTSAACIIVESERFSGYLVAVMGKNRKIDQVFIDSVKAKLFKFLKDNGEEVSDNDGMEIKIKQVDFEPWALEYAEFLRKSVHEGNEVAMAFFPRRPIKAILEDSHQKDMAKISLNELQGDRQVEFDLYVYLPNNNKYVLYTPKGGVFYNKQMDRLKKQGVTHMHVQKDAVAAISKYQAQNYLNDMIEDHEQKQEAAAQQAALAAKIRAA